MARLAEALGKPEERDAAASAIRGLIERIVLTPGEKWGEMHATLRGALGAILEWAGSGAEKEKTDTPVSERSADRIAANDNGAAEARAGAAVTAIARLLGRQIRA